MRALGVETPTPIEIDIFDVENNTDGILLQQLGNNDLSVIYANECSSYVFL